MRAWTPVMALVRRELRVSLRQTRSFVCLAVFVAACALVAINRWPQEGLIFTQASQAAYGVLALLVATMAAGAVVLLPGLSAVSIVGERDKGTFDELNMTLLGPWSIVIGKLLSVAAFYVLLLAAAMPVAGVALFLVGVELWQVLVSFEVLLGIGMLFTSVGLYRSFKSKSVLGSVLTAYLTCIPIAVLAVGLIAMVASGPMLRWTNLPTDWLLIVSYGLVPWSFALHYVTVSVRELRRAPKPMQVPKEKIIDDAAALEARRKRFPYYLIDPLKRKAPCPDGRNPVLDRELRWGIGARAQTNIRIFYLFLGFVVLEGLWLVLFHPRTTSSTLDGRVTVILASQIAATILIAPGALTATMANGLSAKHLDMLRMSSLPPAQLVRGHLGAVAGAAAPFVAAHLLGDLVVGYLYVVRSGWYWVVNVSEAPRILGQGMLMLGVVTLLALGTSTYASVLCRRISAAIVTSYLLCFAVLLAVWTCAVSVWALQTQPKSALVVATHLGLLVPGPEATPRLAPEVIIGSMMGLQTYRLPFHLWLEGVAAFAVVGVAFVFLSQWHFRRRRMQDR